MCTVTLPQCLEHAHSHAYRKIQRPHMRLNHGDPDNVPTGCPLSPHVPIADIAQSWPHNNAMQSEAVNLVGLLNRTLRRHHTDMSQHTGGWHHLGWQACCFCAK